MPSEFKIREFIRLWRFSEAFYSIIGIRFYDVCTRGSQLMFGEAKTKHYDLITRTDSDNLSDLLPPRVVVFTTYKVPKNTQLVYENIAAKVSNMWQSKNIGIVFNRLFKQSTQKFSSNVVYEAIVNALRHPACSRITVASSIQTSPAARYNKQSAISGYFTLVMWDDGESIITSLRRGIEIGSIRTWYDKIFNCINYELSIKNNRKKINRFTLPSDYTPTESDDDNILLLSSILPGISSCPSKPDIFQHPDRNSENSILSLPGMGLYLLTRTVVFQFGGSVVIRTKNCYLSIKKSKKIKKTFECKIEEMGAPFIGNMLTIRIPILKEE